MRRTWVGIWYELKINKQNQNRIICFLLWSNSHLYTVEQAGQCKHHWHVANLLLLQSETPIKVHAWLIVTFTANPTPNICFILLFPASTSDWVQTTHVFFGHLSCQKYCMFDPFNRVPASQCVSLWPVSSGDHTVSVQTNCIQPEAVSVFSLFSMSFLCPLFTLSSPAAVCTQCHPCIPSFRSCLDYRSGVNIALCLRLLVILPLFSQTQPKSEQLFPWLPSRKVSLPSTSRK